MTTVQDLRDRGRFLEGERLVVAGPHRVEIAAVGSEGADGAGRRPGLRRRAGGEGGRGQAKGNQEQGKTMHGEPHWLWENARSCVSIPYHSL